VTKLAAKRLKNRHARPQKLRSQPLGKSDAVTDRNPAVTDAVTGSVTHRKSCNLPMKCDAVTLTQGEERQRPKDTTTYKDASSYPRAHVKWFMGDILIRQRSQMLHPRWAVVHRVFLTSVDNEKEISHGRVSWQARSQSFDKKPSQRCRCRSGGCETTARTQATNTAAAAQRRFQRM
jgi:hypothetical protein